MLYEIFAIQNNPSRICNGKSSTDDKTVAQLVINNYIEQGHIARVVIEDDNGERETVEYSPEGNPVFDNREALFTGIAKKHLFIETLEAQNSDSLDFHDVSVWGVRKALNDAYNAGKTS